MTRFQAGTQAIAKARSDNAKIGNAATTYVEQRSCPTTCRFFDGGGCYAEDGALGKFVTGPLNDAAAESVFETREEAALVAAYHEADAIDALDVTDRRPLRLHTVGDCATDWAAKVVAAAAARYVERGGGMVWTYTHAWADVERVSWGAVSVLASCETVEDVAAAKARGYATSIVVDDFPGTDKRYDLDGVAVLPCPEQTRGITCVECGLCMIADQLEVTIGFRVHGNALTVRKAHLALEDPDSQTRRLTSRELIPPLEEAFIAEHGYPPTATWLAEQLGLSKGSVWEMRKNLRLESESV